METLCQSRPLYGVDQKVDHFVKFTTCMCDRERQSVYQIKIRDWTTGFENPGPRETQPFSQTRNPGLRAAKTRVSGLCTFQQQIVQQFKAFFTSHRSQTVQMSSIVSTTNWLLSIRSPLLGLLSYLLPYKNVHALGQQTWTALVDSLPVAKTDVQKLPTTLESRENGGRRHSWQRDAPALTLPGSCRHDVW